MASSRPAVATFSDPRFNAAHYRLDRPDYAPRFFDKVVEYRSRALDGSHDQHDSHDSHDLHDLHSLRELAVDLGAGTGQIAVPLADTFQRVVAVEPSAAMRASAEQHARVVYVDGTAEHIRGVEPHSVDLLTVGQAAHWFDRETFVREAVRVLKPGGALAIVGYKFMEFPNHPHATRLVHDMAYGSDKLGPFWPSGREVLDNLFRDWPALQPLVDEERHYYPKRDAQTQALIEPPLMQLDLSMSRMRRWLKTGSAYFRYRDAHPDRPDIVDATVDEIVRREGIADQDAPLPTDWVHVLILARAPPLPSTSSA